MEGKRRSIVKNASDDKAENNEDASRNSTDWTSCVNIDIVAVSKLAPFKNRVLNLLYQKLGLFFYGIFYTEYQLKIIFDASENRLLVDFFQVLSEVIKA